MDKNLKTGKYECVIIREREQFILRMRTCKRTTMHNIIIMGGSAMVNFYFVSSILLLLEIILILGMDWYVYVEISEIEGNTTFTHKNDDSGDAVEKWWLGLSVFATVFGVLLITVHLLLWFCYYYKDIQCSGGIHVITMFLAVINDLPLQIVSLITLNMIKTEPDPCELASGFILALKITGGLSIGVSIVRLVKMCILGYFYEMCRDYSTCISMHCTISFFFHIFPFALSCAVFIYSLVHPCMNH